MSTTGHTYWSSTNNSATPVLRHVVHSRNDWNDSCAQYGLRELLAPPRRADTPAGIDLVGRRRRAEQLHHIQLAHCPSVTCTGGYAKPAWQTGTGVPNDGARDIPDVSLFRQRRLQWQFLRGLRGRRHFRPEYDLLQSG